MMIVMMMRLMSALTFLDEYFMSAPDQGHVPTHKPNNVTRRKAKKNLYKDKRKEAQDVEIFLVILYNGIFSLSCFAFTLVLIKFSPEKKMYLLSLHFICPLSGLTRP